MLPGSGRLNALPDGILIVHKLSVPSLLDVSEGKMRIEIEVLRPKTLAKSLMVASDA